MKYLLLIAICIFHHHLKSYSQANSRILYIIDSIPLMTDPASWDQLLPTDIADTFLLNNKDAIKSMGWEQMDAIVYVFTKAYRERIDSIKHIPGLRQMVQVDGLWMYRNHVYTGPYRNYYLDGQLQAKGSVVNGKIDGEVTSYFKNEIKKSIINYKEGVKQGHEVRFYKNGAMQSEFLFGKELQHQISNYYFINGQLQSEFRQSSGSGIDTLIEYYSSGKMRKIKIGHQGDFNWDKKYRDLVYYSMMFSEHIRRKDIRAANKDLFQVKKLDSNSIETIFMEGVLMLGEFRFERAVEQFNRALTLEPLMKEALAQRAIARMKLFKHRGVPLQSIKDIPLVLDDLLSLPKAEQDIVCSDIRMVDYLDINLEFSFDNIPLEIINYCLSKNNLKHQ